ncbi:MAG TPA: ROK family protein, partial [Spirochaetia bacterium]|nr:ROK family protein [Spirochaetia bacterium]
SLRDEESKRIKEDRKILDRVLRELSSHIAFHVNALNLTSVVIGGEIAAYRDTLTEMLEEEIQKNWSYENKVDCAIEFATLGDRAVAYGAAGMFLERFFSIPDVVESAELRTSNKIGVLYAPRQSAAVRQNG